MAGLTTSVLTAPVSDDNPCGADLDLTGDPDFLNFLARAEGLLPNSYFSGPESRPFDRSTIDFDAELDAAQPLLARTRDIRLLVLLAKFSILSRDLNSFVACIDAIAHLLEGRWDDVHPRGEAGDFTARTAVVETLNDSAPILIPLQYVPLLQSRRFGAVSYRNLMFANGEATPRESEQVVDPSNLDRAFMEADLPGLADTRAKFAALKTAFQAIEKSYHQNAADGALSLEKVLALVDKILIVLTDVVAKRDPDAAAASTAADGHDTDATPASTTAAGAIRSRADVLAALDAIDAYFCRCEPSNPALLLARQVRQLAGKSLLEVLQILVPGQISDAKFRLTGSQSIDIPVESLAAVATIEEPDMVNGGQSEDEPTADEAPARSPALKVADRQEAFALLEQIGAYYRVTEPSSPISLIIERARGFANRDFLSILKDLLPKSTD